MGLNDPQFALPQVTVQFTPRESFVTAVIAVMLLICTDEGGAGLKVTVIGGMVMVIAAETDFVLSAVEVAVIVTSPPLGTADGAV